MRIKSGNKLAKCIYCFKEGDNFSSEHVIPEAIGLYGTNTPVLNCVCDECNKYFDRTLENPVFRKSIYNFARHELMSEEKPVLTSKSKSRMIESNDFIRIAFMSKDALNGALLRINIDTKNVDFASQVGFKKKDGKEEYDFFPAQLIKKDKQLTKKLIQKTRILKDKNKLFVYGGTDKEHKKLCSFLFKQGIKFNKECVNFNLPTSGKREFVATISFNDIFKRLISKIAFNYFSYCSAEQLGDEYLLGTVFDQIRKYIRYGQNDSGVDFVKAKKLNIVSGEKECHYSSIKTNLKAHLLTVNSTGGVISAIVDLFHRTGFFVCEVLLGKPKIGISFHEGRCFDYKNKKISKMTSKHIFDRAGVVLPGAV